MGGRGGASGVADQLTPWTLICTGPLDLPTLILPKAMDTGVFGLDAGVMLKGHGHQPAVFSVSEFVLPSGSVAELTSVMMQHLTFFVKQ